MRRITVLLVLMLFAFAINTFGQVVNYTFTQSEGTYVPISGGTVHATDTWDDAMIANVPIGFSFSFDGAEFTQVTISPNGYLIFGGTSSLGYAPLSSTSAAAGAVAAIGRDLQGRAGSEIRSELLGTAGDYIFVVQWTDAKRYGTSYPDEFMDFQIKLHQNGNVIELAYGEFAGVTYPATPIHPQVGVRGATNLDFVNRTTIDNWLLTTAGTLNSNTCAIDAVVKPVDGLSFSYAPPAGLPELPVNPSPVAGATDVSLDGELTWDFGANTDTYDLWFGPAGNMEMVVEDAPAGTSGSYAYSGLDEISGYQWQVVAKNANFTVNGPVWGFTTVFLSGIAFTYTDGDIPTDYGNPWVGPSTCPGEMTVTIPEGMWIVDMSVTYSMTAANGAWMSEQRSKIYSPTLQAGEASYASGAGTSAGTFNYSRSGLSFANNATGEIVFQMDAGRTYGNTAPNNGCGTYYNKVDNNSWSLFFFLEEIPECDTPKDLMVENIAATSVDVSWTPGFNTSLWNLKYGAPGFDPAIEGELIAGIEAPEYMLDGLDPVTEYDLYVQSDCNEEAVSEWVGPVNFTTISLFDLSIVEIPAPMDMCYEGPTPVTIVLTNLGGADVTVPFEVSYAVDGGAPVAETANITVAAGATVEYTFTTLLEVVLTEDFTFELSTQVTLEGDANPANDALAKEVTFYLFPEAPAGVDATASAGSTATLQAISPNEIFWYDSPDGTTVVGTGEFFETPVLFNTTSFYAAAVAGANIADGNLETTFAAGNGCGAGNMFDLEALGGDRTITGFTINPNATNAAAPVIIWTKSGTFVGSESNQAAWTQLGTYTVNAVALEPVFVDIDDFVVPGGEITGVYVQADLAYTNVTGLTTYQDDLLSITGGAGFCTAFSPIANRMFNGRVHYEIIEALCYSERTEVTAFVPQGSVEGYVMEASRGAIEGARVFSGDYEAFTDAEGYFFIDNVSVSTYDFTAEADGYYSQTVEGVEVFENQTTQVDFTLGFATIAVDPTSLEETLSPGFTSTQTLTISNDGTETLEWDAMIEYLEPERASGGQLPSKGVQEPLPVIESQPQHEIAEGGNMTLIKGSSKSLSNSRDVLWDNGPLVNSPGTGAGGADESILQSALGMTSYGAGVQQTAGNSVADEFVVDAEWNVESFEFFVYQTGSSLTSTITGVFFRVWDGVPNDGGQIIYGDLTTNALEMTEWSNIYRNNDGPGGSTNRPVMRVVASATDLLLPAGTYWVEATFTGSLASGPWMPPITINDQTETGNALQNVSGTWQPLTDGGTLTDQGIAFIVNGTSNPWVSLDILSGSVLPGESQSVEVTFNAGDLIDSTYLANININHNGLETGRGTVVVPVSLTVASSQPPLPPTDFIPVNNAEFVELQPEFSWTNGEGTAQVRFQLNRFAGIINPLVYSSPWFVGNSISLADLGITLLEKTNYRWQVFAKNAAGEVTSGFLFFQTVGSGTIAGVVTDSFSGEPMQGVSITADEFRFSAVTDENGLYNIPDVPEGEYSITASFEGYIEQTQTTVVEHDQTSFVSFELDLFLTPPFGLQAEIQDIFDVQLSWSAPGGAWTPVWLTYSGEEITNSIGTNGPAEFDVAARYEPAQLAEFPGGAITKMQFVPGEPDITCTYTLKVWQGTSPPTLIYSQELPSIVADEWNEVVLDTPVPFDNTDELWFGFGVNTTAGFPAGCDDGPQVEGFGNMMFFNGAWTTLTQLAPTLTFNWAVKAYVEVAGKGLAELTPVKENTSNYFAEGTLAARPEKISPPAISIETETNRALQGFNVYKNGDLLTYTTETEYLDQALEPGDYAYEVSAVYDEGESDLIGPVSVSILAPPTLLSAEQVGNEIDLAWESNFVGKNMLANQGAGASVSASNYLDVSGKEKRLHAPYIAPEGARQGGDLIESAFVITAIPFTETGTTTGYTDDYDEVCPNEGSTAPDVVYAYTPSESTFLNIDMCGSFYDTKIYVYENAYTPGDPYACNDDYYLPDDPCGDWVSAIFGMPVTAGSTYYIVVDGYGTDNGEYAIEITEGDPPCTVECPPNAIAESEACGDDLNGGCNMDVPAFEPIAMGDVVCGTIWADGGTRDTDWFEVEITTPMLVTFSVTAEFPSVIGLLQQFEPGVPGCENITGSVSPFALGLDCEAASVEVTLLPGTHYFFVSADAFEDYPCGSSNAYFAEITGEEVFVPFFTVYKDGEAIADVYNTTYTDMAVMPGAEYCYTVTETVDETGLETGLSNEICVDIPLYGLLSVDPESLFEEHIPAPQMTTQSITLTNDGDGVMEFAVSTEVIENTQGTKEYCTGGPTSAIDSNVTLVELDGEDSNIAHIGCPGVVGLEDLTTQVADLLPGGEYTVSVEWGTCGGNYANAGTVWIDWNGDQTFTTDEIIGTWSGTPTVLENYTFTVPASAVPGFTRMRVMQQEGGTLPLNPCASYSWGSKMDFGIEVIDNRWVKTEPESGTLNPGESITLDVIFNSEGLDFGSYFANLNFTTNNPFATQPEVVVPVELVADADLGTISGFVTDMLGSRGPVQGVSITADEFRTSYSTTTDVDGYYELIVPAGVYTVTAEKDGYATQTVEGVTVVMDEITPVDFMLDILGPTLLSADGGIGQIEIGWEGNPLFDAKRGAEAGSVSYAAVQPVKVKRETEYIPENGSSATLGRAQGDECADPLDYGFVNDLPVNGFTDPGQVTWYSFTANDDFSAVEVSLCGSDFDTKLEVWYACDDATYAFYNDDFCGLQSQVTTGPMVSGTTWFAKVYGYSASSTGDYTLTITGLQECVIECPPDAIPEGEVCLEDEAVDDFNGGCNSVPAVFSPINNGDVICGTASTFSFDGSNFRDTDWYEIVLDEPATITWSVTAEFPSLAFIIDGTNGCDQQLTVGFAEADPCETATVTATVPPGTYWMIALPSVFEGYPCGTSNTYIAEFSYEEAFLPYFNLHRDGDFIAQVYGNSYTDMDVEADVQYCYTVTQVPYPGFETPESNELCASVLCAAGCDYTMVLTDDFGDGWNGASVTFVHNGVALGEYTLAGGDTGSAAIELCDGLDISLVWSAGFYDIECGFELYDPDGILIYSFEIGDAPLPGEFFTFTTACPELPEQMIVMEEGWNAWSSYINPDARMGMDELMAPVLDDMIVTQYFFELFYPEFGINNMSAFSNNHGYLTKMSAPATLPIVGMMADPMVDLVAGWNLMPVLQECPIAAADVFANIAGFEIAWDPMGNGIYYPAFDIYTLETLMPGKAYWVKVSEQGSYTYPGCVEKGNVPGNAASIRAANTTNWNDVNYNPVNHAVVLSDEAVAALQIGDLIGAFTADGMLAGLAEATGETMGLQLYGDDFVTMGKDGFNEGESITYRVYRPATTEEFEVEATYSTDAPNADGLFDINGVSVITDLKLAPTSIGASLMNGLSIYPNPSNGVFNIAVSNLDQDVKYVVSNAQGQEVYSGSLSESQILDLSSEPKGVYLIRFINNEVLGVKKLIIK